MNERVNENYQKLRAERGGSRAKDSFVESIQRKTGNVNATEELASES